MLWLIPSNDGEAIEIRRLLDEHRQNVIVTQQPWGASWANLEPHIQAAVAKASVVYAVELSGPAPPNAINIDHHDYSDDHSRMNTLSSLEQIANILGIELNRWSKLVAANDRGYIDAMVRELNASPQEIAAVRLADRRAQGVTQEEDSQALRAVLGAQPQGNLWIVPVEGRLHSAYGDYLYSVRNAREWLLQATTEWAYSGPRHRQLMKLGLPEQHWCGGAPASGYFGIDSPSPPSQRAILLALASGLPSTPQSLT